MGLYLVIFDNEDEVEGVEVGHYSDFADFRDAVVKRLERGVAGTRFPTLILHSDCDGEWTPQESALLESELAAIRAEFEALPPIPLKGWQKDIAKTFGINPSNLSDCFFDVDGEPLLDRLIGLARISQTKSRPILFQ